LAKLATFDVPISTTYFGETLPGGMEPDLNPQARDLVEISGVCRQQGCAMLQRDAGDLEIQAADPHTLLSQPTKGRGGILAETEDVPGLKEPDQLDQLIVSRPLPIWRMLT